MVEKFVEGVGLGTPFLYAAGTYALFHWFDSDLSDGAKLAFARFLNAKAQNGAMIASALVELFDRVYSRPLLTLRAFARWAVYECQLPVRGSLDLPSAPRVGSFNGE
jgi:hypothetical protein